MLTYDEARLTLDLIEYRDWRFELSPEMFWPEEEYADRNVEVSFWLITKEGGQGPAVELIYDADQSWLVHRAFELILDEERRQATARFTWKKRHIFATGLDVDRLWDAAGRS